MAYRDPPKKRATSRQWYKKNRDQVIAAQRKRRQTDQYREIERAAQKRREKRLWLIEVLGGQCVGCGEQDEWALDVHHPNGKDAPLAYQRSWEYIKEQAMVTILLCSTCHRRNHKPS